MKAECCNTCGKANLTPEYRNCADCREFWRLRQRKPDSKITLIEQLQKENEALKQRIARLEQKYGKD